MPGIQSRIAAIACGLLLAGCKEKRAPGPPEPITIAHSAQPHSALIYIAAAGGYFADQGLGVTLVPYGYGRLALASMIAGKADLATCAETPLVFAALAGTRASALATIATSATNTAVVARRDAGIAAPGDLAEKRVAVMRGTTSEFFLDTLLVQHGVPRASIRPVDMSPEVAAEAIAKGEVDAVSIWNPFIIALERRLGDAVRTFHAENIYFETFNLVGRPAFVEQHPAAVKKVLRALVRAAAFFQEHPDEARRMVVSGLGGEAADTEATLRQFAFQVRLDESLLLLLEEQARWAIRSGQVAKQEPPNFLATMAPGPLLEVRPDAVGLIR